MLCDKNISIYQKYLSNCFSICEMNNAYGEGQFKPNVAYVYILFINNISQFVAMYCLVLFYKANRQELQAMKPLPKFLCIKAVIFFSFFQGVIISFLVYFGFISNVFGEEDPDKTDPHLLSTKLQDFLICIEMFIAAVAHHYSFPHKPFHINAPNYDTSNRGFLNALKTMLDISDVRDDLGEHIGVVGSSFARRLQGRSNYYHVPRGKSVLIWSNFERIHFKIFFFNDIMSTYCNYKVAWVNENI